MLSEAPATPGIPRRDQEVMVTLRSQWMQCWCPCRADRGGVTAVLVAQQQWGYNCCVLPIPPWLSAAAPTHISVR